MVYQQHAFALPAKLQYPRLHHGPAVRVILLRTGAERRNVIEQDKFRVGDNIGIEALHRRIRQIGQPIPKRVGRRDTKIVRGWYQLAIALSIAKPRLQIGRWHLAINQKYLARLWRLPPPKPAAGCDGVCRAVSHSRLTETA